MDVITFGTGILYGTALNDAAGNALATPTPVQFAQLQDISLDFQFEQKMLHGSGQFPIAIGRGKGKIELKAKTATVSADMLGAVFFGQAPTSATKSVVNNQPAAVPASPFQVTPTVPASGTFVADLGVLDAANGAPLQRVASAPATGQYSVTSGGVYTFASADTGKALLFSFEYSATSTLGRVLTLTNLQMGQMPFFRANLTTIYGTQSRTVVLNRCASNKINLPLKNDDFTITDFDFDAFADAAGNIGYMSFSQ